MKTKRTIEHLVCLACELMEVAAKLREAKREQDAMRLESALPALLDVSRRLEEGRDGRALQ